MNFRNVRQQEIANAWLDNGRFGIVNAAPRVGKIRITCLILEKLNPHCTVLIAYPDLKIKKSWEDDFVKWGYSNPNITFTTYMSLKKYKDKIFDLIILDEVHLLSDAQIEVCKELFENNN